MKCRLLSLLVWLGLVLTSVLAESKPPEELFVPILINGVVDGSSHYQTIFRFVELSGTTADAAVLVQLDAFDNTGKAINANQLFCPPPVASSDPFQVTLPGSGSIHFGTKGFIQPYDPAPGVIDGWARLTIKGPGQVLATADILQVETMPAGCPPVICNRPSGLYKSDAVVTAVKPATAFRAAAVITPYRHTAFAVVNPSETKAAHVFLELLNPDGTVLEKGEALLIPPRERRSAFAWEWATIPLPLLNFHRPRPDDFYGSARIVSDVPVAVGALQVLLPEFRLVTAVVTPEP